MTEYVYVMRKCLVIYAMLSLLILVSSCDFLRRVAGRPDSAEIALKKAAIEKAEAEHQARLDSIRLVEKKAADSLAVIEQIRQSENTLVSAGKLGGLVSAQLSYRYYIIVGSFSVAENAQKLASKAEEAGFKATTFACKNGFTGVGVCPSDNLPEVFKSLQEVKQQPFCPVDAWILVNE